MEDFINNFDHYETAKYIGRKSFFAFWYLIKLFLYHFFQLLKLFVVNIRAIPVHQSIVSFKKNLEICKTFIFYYQKKTRNMVKRNENIVIKTRIKLFTIDDKNFLYNLYRQNKYPQQDDILRMANHTGKTEDQIKRWFRNTRYAEKQ